MADFFTVVFDFMGFALHLGSQVVHFLCTLVNLNHELIAAALEALLRILGTMQAILLGVTLAFVDVVVYVVEITTRLMTFASRLVNGATTAFEAACEISQFLTYSVYTIIVYAIKASRVFASWTFSVVCSVFTMLLDSAPLLMTKCACLFHNVLNVGHNFWHKGEDVIANIIHVTEHISDLSWSILIGCWNMLLTPFVDLKSQIDEVVETIFMYQFELFLFFLSLCISGIIMLSYTYLLMLCHCFCQFLNCSVLMIGSRLQSLASQFTNNEIMNNYNNEEGLDQENHNDSSGDESDNQSDIGDHVDSQSEAQDSDSENESEGNLGDHRRVLTDWLGLHEQNGRTRRRNMHQTRNTFGIDSEMEENVDYPGPSGYNLRSNRRTPDRASPGRQFRTLKRELEEEKDRRLCVICQDNEKNVLVLPCKHMCMCEECADEVLNNEYIDRRLCPLCRSRITKAIDVYL